MTSRISELFTLVALGMSIGTAALAEEPIRVGWQTTWAVQGQLVMGLMETPIGSHNGLELEFFDFPFGGPLNQAAIGGAVDVVLTADQPALLLLSKSDDFVVAGRMMYNRVCLYAPVGSEIASVGALDGKRISGPVGAAAERFALDRLQAEGLDLEKITFGNLDMAEQSALLLSAGPTASEWRGVDALYGFDPHPAAFAADGYAKVLDCGPVVSVVLIRKSTLLSQPQKAADFMCAFTAAWHQYAADPGLMNDLFLERSGLKVSHAVLDESASLEPNLKASSADQFSFGLKERDLEIFDSANRFLTSQGTLEQAVDVAAFIDQGPLDAALASQDCAALKASVPFGSVE
jgi:ABC-type nitrate/sulfonate/bicarbonate transport system substrate-binding protein